MGCEAPIDQAIQKLVVFCSLRPRSSICCLFLMNLRAFIHRLFLSAEPPPALEKGLPISLLQNCIRLTNEPPEGLKVGWTPPEKAFALQTALCLLCTLKFGRRLL